MFRWLLMPLSWLYAIPISIRNFCYDNNIFSSQEFDFPIITVGNITVGGTGKTPHIEYLVNLLSQNYKIAVLSRGYKRKTKGYLLAKQGFGVREIGDEPLQIFQKFPEIKVAVDGNRIRGASNLIKNENIEVILLDDGFQHRKIKAGLSILLIDFSHPLEQDSFLPYGKLRESASQKCRANVIIVTKCPADLKPIDKRIFTQNLNIFPYQTLFFSTIKYGHFVSIFQNKIYSQKNVSENKFSILLVTGIANSLPLKNFIESLCKNVLHLSFSDHHNFSESDIFKIKSSFSMLSEGQKIIVTTEKDAMRLRENPFIDEAMKEKLFYIPIFVNFLFNDKEEFNQKIISYVGQNQRNSSIHFKNDRV